MPINITRSQFCKKREISLLSYQKEVANYVKKGYSGIVSAPTGRGKTLSIFLPLLQQILDQDIKNTCSILWITPMRALAKDTTDQLISIAEDLKFKGEILFRTSDTSSAKRSKIKQKLPQVLVTTPESFSLLLTYPDVINQLKSIQYCVVDEWHELLHTKRGVQTQLCISRLVQCSPKCNIWGLSATLADISDAKNQLLFSIEESKRCVVKDDYQKKLSFKSVFNSSQNSVGWQGFMGSSCLDEVEKIIKQFNSVLFFTNTRSQAERWYQLLIQRFDQNQIRLHHSALDKQTRTSAENDLNTGKARCIVCTSGLDLGVDFQPVDHIIQCGSPKGIARFVQRAGRSGHNPTGESTISVIPTHTFEWIELECLKAALQKNILEEKIPLQKPIDVLIQHIITVSLAEPIDSNELYTHICQCPIYDSLTKEEWNWILDFLTNQHSVLRAYPEHCKLIRKHSLIQANDKHNLPLLHRFSIGTIYSEEECMVCYKTGKKIGTIEESFIKQLRPGQSFLFAGHILELISFRSMTAIVKKSTKKASVYVRWLGGRMQLSTQLGNLMKQYLNEAEQPNSSCPKIVKALLKKQATDSIVPKLDELLVELIKDKYTYKAVFYLFSGRQTHESLGLLFSYRLLKNYNLTASVQVNDYAVMIQSSKPFPLETQFFKDLFSLEKLTEDISNAINIDELAAVKFKEIAQISGLHNKGLPGKLKSVAYSKSSAQLLYELFKNYDPENLLLEQSSRSTLASHVNFSKIKSLCNQVESKKIRLCQLTKISPFAFPLLIEQLSSQLSNEDLIERIDYLLKKAS